MNDRSEQLVEHFFRHESANLIAVLSRVFGFARLDLIEDMVQAAMLEAMNAWRHKGIPQNPTAWIHRVARNRIVDVLRREKVHQRALAFAGQSIGQTEALVDHWLEEDQISDSLLRMMFVCCDESLDRRSQVALTLKILCGFSVNEISRGLLAKPDTIKKRIQRAKQKLAAGNLNMEIPGKQQLQSRIETVHSVLYLMFNEGYSTSHGIDPIRDDLCEEATRLCHLLCENAAATTTTYALLALMLFHAARLESRIDQDGAVVLLEDQDRSTWDRKLVNVALFWLGRSGEGPVSQYHLQAAIAMQHCRAPTLEATNWNTIVNLYDRLIAMHSSPIYILNRAIARAENGDIETATTELKSIANHPDLANYYLLDCSRAKLHELKGEKSLAIDCYLNAMSRDIAPHERNLLEKKIARLS